MKLTITNKIENPLLDRKRVEASVEFEGATPSNNEVISLLAKGLNTDPHTITIHTIASHFSERRASILAYAYQSAEAKKKGDVITKHIRKQAEEAAKKAAEEKAAASSS